VRERHTLRTRERGVPRVRGIFRSGNEKRGAKKKIVFFVALGLLDCLFSAEKVDREGWPLSTDMLNDSMWPVFPGQAVL